MSPIVSYRIAFERLRACLSTTAQIDLIMARDSPGELLWFFEEYLLMMLQLLPHVLAVSCLLFIVYEG